MKKIKCLKWFSSTLVVLTGFMSHSMADFEAEALLDAVDTYKAEGQHMNFFWAALAYPVSFGKLLGNARTVSGNILLRAWGNYVQDMKSSKDYTERITLLGSIVKDYVKGNTSRENTLEELYILNPMANPWGLDIENGLLIDNYDPENPEMSQNNAANFVPTSHPQNLPPAEPLPNPSITPGINPNATHNALASAVQGFRERNQEAWSQWDRQNPNNNAEIQRNVEEIQELSKTNYALARRQAAAFISNPDNNYVSDITKKLLNNPDVHLLLSERANLEALSNLGSGTNKFVLTDEIIAKTNAFIADLRDFEKNELTLSTNRYNAGPACVEINTVCNNAEKLLHRETSIALFKFAFFKDLDKFIKIMQTSNRSGLRHEELQNLATVLVTTFDYLKDINQVDNKTIDEYQRKLEAVGISY